MTCHHGTFYLPPEVGNAPLHHAAIYGHAEVVGVLLAGGADIGAVNKV